MIIGVNGISVRKNCLLLYFEDIQSDYSYCFILYILIIVITSSCTYRTSMTQILGTLIAGINFEIYSVPELLDRHTVNYFNIYSVQINKYLYLIYKKRCLK